LRTAKKSFLRSSWSGWSNNLSCVDDASRASASSCSRGRLLDAPQDIPVLTPLIEGEILYRLLTGPFGPRLRQIAITETPSNRIAAAIAWLKQNFMRPLRIEELGSA
jgi:hypothetical protein